MSSAVPDELVGIDDNFDFLDAALAEEPDSDEDFCIDEDNEDFANLFQQDYKEEFVDTTDRMSAFSVIGLGGGDDGGGGGDGNGSGCGGLDISSISGGGGGGSTLDNDGDHDDDILQRDTVASENENKVGGEQIITNTELRKRGRPKGSKNKKGPNDKEAKS